MYKKKPGIFEKQDVQSLLKELEAFRVANNIPKTKLARKLGMRSPVTIFYWYKGICKPYPRTLYRIIKLLGKQLTVEEFKDWQKEPSIHK